MDISDEAIANCVSLKLPAASFHCCDGHTLPVLNDSLDVVIVNSLLHHMDLVKVLDEITKVLKSGGLLCFREPLGTNPLFMLYRWLTPSARTVDERPLTRADLALISRYFELKDTSWFGFLSIISAYFKSPRLNHMLIAFDQLLSRTPMRILFWQISGVAVLKK